MKKFSFLSLIMAVALLVSCNSKPAVQQMDYSEFTNVEYWQVVSGRAVKIVDAMELNDTIKAKQVQDLIAAQYYRLNGVYDSNDIEIRAIKASELGDEEKTREVESIKANQQTKVDGLHADYVSNLSKLLTPEQVDAVKDGMTYSVAPNTYAAFLDMIPDLTEPQKKFIWDALYEAREHAMDAGSSKEKHGWFGKYKGRINNYLAKEGYDLNTLSNDWHERLKARGIQL
ncbi:MAG: DUF3826 domain-containing protein [Mangrovibacterium sp.]